MKILSPTFALCLLLASSFAWSQNAIESCDLFDEGPNSTWSHVLTATTPDDPNSSGAQSLEIFITSPRRRGELPRGQDGGQWELEQWQRRALGVGCQLCDGQRGFFSPGLSNFNSTAAGGVYRALAQWRRPSCANDLDGVAMETCAGVDAGPNATWPHVVTATTPDDPNSADAQSMSIFVTALPSEGANYRVVKTVANGNWNNGNAMSLSLGLNDVTVSAVSFARSVKFQFSSGLIEFTELSVNGAAISCVEDGCEDADGDGICDDVDPCVGALDACGICNGPGEVYECGCSDIPEGDCDCEGNQADAVGICGGSCQSDDNDNGICDADEEVVDPSVYCGAGTTWDAALNQCIADAAEDLCPADLDGDGSVSTGDLLQFLAAFGQPC